MKSGTLFRSVGIFWRSARFGGVAPAPYDRPITLAKIVTRQKRADVAVASPLDFTLDYVGELSAGVDHWPGTAYCLSHARERALFAICPGMGGLFEAPFLWQAQHQQASHIASIPFERLHEFVCTVPQKPIFVFSIGRCGSTLLSALLRAAGAHTISEPDLLTQLAVTSPEERRRMGANLRNLLIRSCIASLTMERSAPVAIKLRSQCNGIAREIAKAFPGGTYVVMMRDRHAWLHSRLRAFGGDPKNLAALYKRGVQTFHELQSMGMPSLMIWYEDVLDNPTDVLRRLVSSAPSGPRGMADIRSVLDSDSQAGTILEKSNLGRKAPTAELVRLFDDEWGKIRPDAWIERYALERLRPR